MAGLSFLPGANIGAEDRAASSALAPGQSPMQVLTLNLPSILGAKPLASRDLLTPKATSTPQDMVLRALMASMMGGPSAAASGQPASEPLFFAPPTANMNLAEELRRRLGLASASDGTAVAPSQAAAPTQTPIFTPGNGPSTGAPPRTSSPLTPTIIPGDTAFMNKPRGYGNTPITGDLPPLAVERRKE